MGRRGSRLSRRQFVVGTASVGLLAGCGRLPWQSAGQRPVWRIGYLSVGAPTPALDVHYQAFREGLRQYGYIEGQDVILEDRWAEYRTERIADLLAELVELPVSVVVGDGGPVAQAAKTLGVATPVVMRAFGDPVRLGWVSSLAHPGGNITGLTVVVGQLHAKRLELLKTALPGVVRVAVVWNTANPSNLESFLPEAEGAARALGLRLESFPAAGGGALGATFAQIASREVDALMTLADGELLQQRADIARFALDRGLPALFPEREFAEVGGLMAYGPNVPDNFRRAAYYVDRILKGAKPADLPVEQPMTFEFVVNLKTAQALGITFPNEIMLQVTEVVE